MAVDAAPTGKLNPPDSDETPTADGELEASADDADVVDDDADVASKESDAEDASRRTAPSPLMLGLVMCLVSILALAGVSSWLGYQVYRAQQVTSEREQYLTVARQSALNFATVSYENADADVQRILDSATGKFLDEFSAGSQAFVDVVKESQSASQGTVTEAGLESVTGDEAQAIVALSVQTSVAGTPDQQPRSWRMRLTVQKSGDDFKVSDVGFVA